MAPAVLICERHQQWLQYGLDFPFTDEARFTGVVIIKQYGKYTSLLRH